MSNFLGIEDFAARYVAAQSADIPEDDPQWEVIFASIAMAFDEPERCWKVVLAALALRPNERAFGMLSAGLLEDLIEYHGPSLIDRIEAEAATDPDFKLLLQGVWESSTPEVWARVERACLSAERT